MNNLTETMDGLYSLQLQSTTQSVAIMENFVDDLVEQLNIGDDVYANLMTCLNEAVTNAIYHGNKQDPDKKVFVNLEVVNNKRLVFTIADEGNGFDFTNIPDPTNLENLEKLTGRGVYIMKRLADQCIFNSKGNEVELHFKY
ncbi:serine/threonine protein kinase [Pedobacter psychrophilus]|uniref:Serine/threonine protein kinase n=1 Tax=Pedobacter psychrophilus TaxID=1826909 RepID=A0A179DC70_9SPHI|nr:ATP-binding protein [Pedobacter psychrophilus]OAQ38382.1 serine/threonine protein kinase [Pedobacter psychrophilus]